MHVSQGEVDRTAPWRGEGPRVRVDREPRGRPWAELGGDRLPEVRGSFLSPPSERPGLPPLSGTRAGPAATPLS